MARAGVAAAVLAGLAAACGGSEPVGVQLTVSSGECAAAGCRWGASGSGIVVAADVGGGDALAAGPGQPVLYAEAMGPDATTVVVELSFAGQTAHRARYREVRDGRVVFRGRVSEVTGSLPGADTAGPVAGYFSFVATEDGVARHVRGAILPATDQRRRHRVVACEQYVATPTYVSCEGEVYVPPPDLPGPTPDEPWTPDPSPDPMPTPTPSPTPDSTDGTTDSPRPTVRPPPSDSGCEDYDPEPTTSDSGCEGDSMSTSDSGCEGDSMSTSDSGCEGDSASGDSGCEGDSMSSSRDSCEGEGTEVMAAVAPGGSRVFASLARLFWPVGLAGLFNRGARRRRRAAPPA